MLHTSLRDAMDRDNVSSPSNTLAAGDQAGERLHTYARIQTARRQESLRARDVADTVDCFHPQITKLARSSHLERALLYPVHGKAPLTNAEIGKATSPVPLSPPSARVSADQWRNFLSRAVAHERRRDARLLELKMQLAEEAVRECTFRPKLGEQPRIVDEQFDPWPLFLPTKSAGRSHKVIWRLWKQDLDAFSREMETLKSELVSLRLQATDRH